MPELIVNGGFDTGNFNGWSVSSTETSPFQNAFPSTPSAQVVDSISGEPAWWLKDVSTNYFGTPAAPITGYTAFNAFDGSGGTFTLSQTLNIDSVTSGTLSFDFATQSNYSGTARTFDVNLLNAQGQVVANFYHYVLPTGYNTAWTPTHVSVDVSSALSHLATGAYTLAFVETVPNYYTGPADFGIDNISLQATMNHAPVILPDANGLQGLIMQPGTYSSGTTAAGHDYFAGGGAPAATFIATTLNYNLRPGDGDTTQHITTLQQFLDYSGADGNTLSADGDQYPASTYFQMQGLFYQVAGQSYTFTMSSDDGSVMYINGQELFSNDGIHGAGAVTGPTYTATTTGYVPIEFDYFENAYGGASFQALVNGQNFAPGQLAHAVSLAGVLTETANTTGSNAALTSSGSFAFVDQDLSDHHTVSAGPPSLAWSGGTVPSPVVSALAGALSVSIAQDSSASTAGIVNYTFSAPDKAFDFLAAGETLTLTYNVTVDDGHGGTATQPVTVTVTGTNDAPSMHVVDAYFPVPEQPGVTGSSGADSGVTTLVFTDPDLNDHHTLSVSAPSVTWSGGSNLPSGLVSALTGALTTSLADSTGTGSGSVSASFSAPDKAFDFLAQGETLAVTYQVTVDDGHGGTSTVPVTVTVIGANDVPVLSADTGPHAITEAPNTTGSSAADVAATTLAFTDADLSDHHTVSVAAPVVVWSGGSALPSDLQSVLAGALTTSVADSTGSGAGSLSASFSAPDKAFDFLAAGETLTVTYNVTVDDGHGGTATQPVTVTVTGTNDVPTIDAGSVASGTINELPNTTGSAAIDHTGGVVAFTDPDLNDRPTASIASQSVTAKLASGASFSLTAAQVAAFEAAFTIQAGSANSNTGQIDWNYALADKSLDFLGAGETVTVVSNVLVDDHHGGTVAQDVTVTLVGANDPPIPTPDIAGVQKNGAIAIDAAHGVLANDSDPDIHDSLTVGSVNGSAASVGHAVQGTYGTLTLNADGSYDYAANTSPGALPAKGAAYDVFTYTASDGHGGSTAETLVVSVYNNGVSYQQGGPSAATLGGGNGRQMLDAGVGTHTLVGGNGPDILIAGWGETTMTGGRGPDTFVFNHGDFGQATITDFTPGLDALQFDHRVFATAADVLSHAAQSGADVVITVDARDHIVLQNITLGSLHSADLLIT